MTIAIKVLHLAAHMGGGVGKALSGLISQTIASGAPIKHSIVLFEKPEKTQFVSHIRNSGCEVFICPTTAQLIDLIDDADLVQLEWWNHPATIAGLCALPPLPMKLVVWCHSSGLFFPGIPEELIRAAHRFLPSSACSFEGGSIGRLAPQLGDRLAVVSSCGGFAGLPEPETAISENENISVGYFGSFNFAKLHPHFIDYLAAVTIPDFKVRMIGDLLNQDILIGQCIKAGKPDLLEFRGYSTEVEKELASINVLAYLLNPTHYGTAENALLEAMAIGIVPIVLNNPAERQIVEHGRTGLVVNSIDEFADAIALLSNDPQLRHRLGLEAARFVRKKFSLESGMRSLNAQYFSVASMGKSEVSFSKIFGADPAEWFLSCQQMPSIFMEDGTLNFHIDEFGRYGLFEKSKGTVFHFHSYFPDNVRLRLWADNLELLR